MIRKSALLIGILMLVFSNSFAQEGVPVKVLMKEISGSYKGDLKDGLAHGKGTAKGEDTYSGEFKNGLPDGKGKYTYSNGNNFTGYFSKGLKNGKGVFNFNLGGNAMTQKGYWVNDDYVGTTNPEEIYIVSNQVGIDSYSIKKIDDNEEEIIFSISRNGMKYVPSNFNIQSTSGQLLTQGKSLSITNYNLPVNCEISFTVNKSGNIMQCYFTFEILKPGKFNVEIIGPE